MITAGDMAPRPAARAATLAQPSFFPSPSRGRGSGQVAAVRAPFRERFLLYVIYITILASSIAFIEPSPHDGLMGLLAVACIVAGVRFDRRFAVLMLILLMWNVGGLMSLVNVVGREKTVQYAATSIYLAIAALMWACILAENTMPRMSALRSAYILTTVFAAVLGIAGYFNVAGLHDLFTQNDRAMGAFKDPNVYAPFLIWPALVLMHRMLVHRIGLIDLGAFGLIAVALLLAFSRGAWFHFALSGAIMIALSFLTARRASTRMRIFFMTALAFVALVVFIVFLLSIPAIHQMFEIRAQLIQPYDVGQGGRFRLQEIAITSMLKHFNGLGPFGFAGINGSQQHNVYLQAFLVYGWLGGVSYILLVLTTLWIALRSVLVPTPWQSYTIIALAVFAGEVAESFIIDSDHWRHFFLILGMVWGLWAATDRYRRQMAAAPPDIVSASGPSQSRVAPLA